MKADYNAIAGEYVSHVYDELRHKPLDRALLERVAREVPGTICDMGCGPGHVARYLHEHGASVCGVDLSPEMIARARELNPGIDFATGDMLALDTPDNSWNGIVAFYSLIHIPREKVADALTELRRVLVPGGRLLLSFHIGHDVLHRDELWGHAVDLDFVFFEPDEMAGYLRKVGYVDLETIERDPYPGVEFESRRGYMFATKPL